MPHINPDKSQPEKAADITDELADPFGESFRKMAKKYGATTDFVEAMARKLNHEFVPIKRESMDTKRENLKELYAYIAPKILASITDEDIRKASLQQKITSAAIATDKLQILDGKATHRLEVEDRRALSELLPILRKEMERRDMTIDVTPGVSAHRVSAAVEIEDEAPT